MDELYRVLDHARMSTDVGCVLLTGNGPSPRDGGWAFCSGGDQRIRGKDGYKYAEGTTADTIDPAKAGRLHILEVQRLIRFMSKVVICVVPGLGRRWRAQPARRCDLTLASAEHARFKQTDADVASFDGGFGSAYLARQVGQKFAREIFFLGDEYSAEDAYRMGMVNKVVPHAELEAVALEWGKKICAKSPTAQRMLKYAFNLIDDGLVGPADLRRRGDPAGLRHRRGRRGPRLVPGEAAGRLVAVPLRLLTPSLRSSQKYLCELLTVHGKSLTVAGYGQPFPPWVARRSRCDARRRFAGSRPRLRRPCPCSHYALLLCPPPSGSR